VRLSGGRRNDSKSHGSSTGAGLMLYHLRAISMAIGTLDWLRFTYDFEIGPA
jgi:hypothetical protein